MNEETRQRLQEDIDDNRRSEHRLIGLAILSLCVVGVLIAVRLVYFS